MNMRTWRYPLIALMCLILAILACNGDDTSGEKVGEDAGTSKDAAPSATKPAQEIFVVGDVIAVQDHTITLNSAEIKGGVYCAYDAFSRLDVRCFVTIPGNVVTVAVDGQGAEMEVDDGLWQNLVVSGFVRRVMMVSPADPIGHLDGR